jgi:hypothetical protein
MKLIGDAHNVNIWFTITVETMVVVSDAPLHLLIEEIFVPSLENQSRGILDIKYDYFILWYDLYGICPIFLNFRASLSRWQKFSEKRIDQLERI